LQVTLGRFFNHGLQPGCFAGNSGTLHKLREVHPQSCPQAMVADAETPAMCPGNRQAAKFALRLNFVVDRGVQLRHFDKAAGDTTKSSAATNRQEDPHQRASQSDATLLSALSDWMAGLFL
jgi:hypothetical protein